MTVHDANSFVHQDEGKFDPRSIPPKSWNDYVSFSYPLPYSFVNILHQENELWDKESKSTQILALLLYMAEKPTTSPKDSQTVDVVPFTSLMLGAQ